MTSESTFATNDDRCIVGGLTITRDGLRGEDISYKLSAFSGLQLKPRFTAIFFLILLGSDLGLLIFSKLIIPIHFGVAWRAWGWDDVILAVAGPVVLIGSIYSLVRHVKLVGKLSSGGSIILAPDITRDEGHRALSFFSRFQNN